MENPIAIIDNANRIPMLDGNVVSAMKKVFKAIERDYNKSDIGISTKLLSYTSKDWVDLINKELGYEKVSYQSFNNWINNKVPKENGHDFQVYQMLRDLRRKEKESILNLMVTEPKAWQRFAWILERKYPKDFGLNTVKTVEKTTTHKEVREIKLSVEQKDKMMKQITEKL